MSSSVGLSIQPGVPAPVVKQYNSCSFSKASISCASASLIDCNSIVAYADASLNGSYPAVSFSILSLKDTSAIVFGNCSALKNPACAYVTHTAIIITAI